MAKDPSSEVLEGNVGFFWPQDDHKVDLRDAIIERGYISQAPDSFVQVRALDEAEVLPGILMPTSSRPVALFGSTEKSGILVPDLMSAGRTGHFGGSKASVRRYRARSVISAVDLHTARSSNLTSASLVFSEGLDFAALSTLHTKFKSDPHTHLLTEAQFTLKADPAANGGKYGSYELILEPDWSTSEDGSTTNLSTGLSITLTVKRPRPFHQFRHLLVGIQDLLNMTYDRFVPAQSGRAVVDGADPSAGRSYLWLQDTMVRPPHGLGVSRRQESTPLFRLADLGGSAGLRRWLRLRDQFSDVAQSISSGHRYGGSRQPSRLLELAAAIEIYVAANRKAGATWAKKATAPTPAEALARRVGSPFLALVGDYATWGERIQDTYNSVKHDPSFARDPDELRLLSWSAQVALLCALLDRAALSKAPSRRILSDYRVARGSEDLRKLLGT
ncbi:hypothetical protein NYO98_03830 [Nocardioides sp. STR2]|uniref:ApeA N-terminal domain-containing protein n=1 Tax=Nocardioides pini TaxID=2975053 RepID=A0ABT4C8W1_9ACTN|nr:hypothetical protein [Nocardioides pini]MCY4725398.1 hypothetical protein [Nocardioides pini]